MEEWTPSETKEKHTNNFRVGAMDEKALTTLSNIALTER
jgi:hypothetical protein